VRAILAGVASAAARFKSTADYICWLASQGGKGRARALTTEERTASAKTAARARWRGVSRQERREAARKAALARWAKTKRTR